MVLVWWDQEILFRYLHP